MTDLYELTIERVIDAPPAAVWQAWTDHKEEWFCPKPWRTEIVAQDLRAGGRSALVMLGPDGERNEMEGIFLEVVPGQRVVSTDVVNHRFEPQRPFMIRIERFEDLGDGRTRYTASARHWAREVMEEHREMGFEIGWGICADQLAEVARRIAGTVDA